ncbi:MAG: MBL fold metallo-hydrolase [Evtepia sp.]
MGQGQCVVVTSGSAHMIDCGGTKDPGTPHHVQSPGARCTLLILTHYHNDHAMGCWSCWSG